MQAGALFDLIVRKTHRVPMPAGPAGDGSAVARQLDAALMDAGWKLSAGLLGRLSVLEAGAALDVGVQVIDVARREVGDHVRHNTYFQDFPEHVPDTVEFWAGLVAEALTVPAIAGRTAGQVLEGFVNLNDLPGYGTYQHRWDEMVAAHAPFVSAASDRLTILDVGDGIHAETSALYLSLAGSRVPLTEDDAAALADLAWVCAAGPQPDAIPVAESRALINATRIGERWPLLVVTVTDVLRLAARLSDGDVSLAKAAKLRSFSRAERREMLEALDKLIGGNEAKLGDVGQYAEQWKQLGRRLKPHEHPLWGHAQDVFAVARAEKLAPSFDARVQAAVGAGFAARAAGILQSAPGKLCRSADWLLREGGSPAEQLRVLEAMAGALPGASARSLLSLRGHLVNRMRRQTDVSRVFVNREGRSWAGPDRRPPLNGAAATTLAGMLDDLIAARLDLGGRIVVDPGILEVALPLSGKATADGLGILPRGSVQVITGEVLRFFCYWRQAERTTDFDLSALLLDDQYGSPQHVSWTNYRTGHYARYSGDLTEAPDGASEFIDFVLPRVPQWFIIPQVNIFSGEGFDEVAESFFGYMLREQMQDGLPFEPATVRAKSEMRGTGRVALPVAFMRGEDGKWRAKWLHLNQKGRPSFNQVEGNRVTTATLTRAIIEREYLTVGYLTGLAAARGADVARWDGSVPDGPVTFIGFEQPDGLPDGSKAITPVNLAELIPA